jgi:hypothetical protein
MGDPILIRYVTLFQITATCLTILLPDEYIFPELWYMSDNIIARRIHHVDLRCDTTATFC